MRLSIIIPVYQSYEIVKRQLLHFQKLRIPYSPSSYELIIVDDNSNPPIKDATIRTENRLAWTQGLARNAGAKVAQGEYLFFTDIDHILTDGAIVDAIEFTGNKMIFRREIAILDEYGNICQDKETLDLWGYEKTDLAASVHGNTFVIRKENFEELGGYDEGASTQGIHPVSRRGEDCYFNAKWNKKYRDVPVVESPNIIYVFPLGRFNKTGDLNPFGFFHDLSQTKQEKFYKYD